MRSLFKRAAVVLAAVAAGISTAAAAISNTVPTPSLLPDHSTKDVAGVPEISGGTGLSFEDLRVGPMGKVSGETGSVKAPVRVAADGQCSQSGKP
jgi:hypothetical protein